MSFSTSSFDRRFLQRAAAAAGLAFGALWLWVWCAPLAFLDPEYPAWRAKRQLLDRCDIGDTLVLGDSRAAAGIMPVLFVDRATNLAVGGGEPIEAFAALRRALRCPHTPRRVILSFDAEHFLHADLFWERTVLFGFVDAGDVTELRDVSAVLNDMSVYEIRHTDRLPSRLRDFLYRARFPPLYFAHLVKAGLFLRWWRNEKTLDTVTASRGQYFFGTENGSDTVAVDGHLRTFRPLPILSWYFKRVLDELASHGIPAAFIAAPMNASTARAVRPDVADAFRAWLADHERRYPGFQVYGDAMPSWPDRFFGDGFAHLNPTGAELFSTGLADCLARADGAAACVQRLQAAPPSTQNEAQYGWFNDTGADASFKVRPSSKRGS